MAKLAQNLSLLRCRRDLGRLIRGEFVDLENTPLEYAYRLGHGADLILAADEGDLRRQVVASQTLHRLGHRRDRDGYAPPHRDCHCNAEKHAAGADGSRDIDRPVQLDGCRGSGASHSRGIGLSQLLSDAFDIGGGGRDLSRRRVGLRGG